MRGSVDCGNTLLREGAVSLSTMNGDAREAIAFSRSRYPERGWLTHNDTPGPQAIHRNQLLRSDASNFFISGQHDTQAIDPWCVFRLGSGQKTRQKSLYI